MQDIKQKKVQYIKKHKINEKQKLKKDILLTRIQG